MVFASLVARAARTTYRGAKGSGPGRSGKTSFRSSPASRPTIVEAVLSGRAFKRAQYGLYDASVPQTGNNIPESVQKTSRTWKPNVHSYKLHSDVLGRTIRTTVSVRALRTIRKYGGLDHYLQRRDGKFLGMFGRTLRNELGAVIRARQTQQTAAADATSSATTQA